MRQFTLISLVFIAACEGYPPELDGSNERGTAAILSSEEVSPTAQALIDATCLDDDCMEILYSASGSIGADTYEWTLNGEFWSNEAEVVVGYELGDFVELELSVHGAYGSDVTHTATSVDGEVMSADQGPTVAGPVFVVILEVFDCAMPMAVASLGSGCLSNPDPLAHLVTVAPPNSHAVTGTLVYDKTANVIQTLGAADAAVWQYNSGMPLGYDHADTRANYGTGVNGQNVLYPYQAVVTGTNLHLTSYYDVSPTGSLTARVSHVIHNANNANVGGAEVTVDCESGLPVFTLSNVAYTAQMERTILNPTVSPL